MPLLGGVVHGPLLPCVPVWLAGRDLAAPPPIFPGVGAPGGTFRPPLPFFLVWAHPVASYAGCSVSVCHGCIKGSALWRIHIDNDRALWRIHIANDRARPRLDASTTDLLRIPAPPCWCCFWRHGKCAMGVSHWDITPCHDAHPPSSRPRWEGGRGRVAGDGGEEEGEQGATD